MIRFARGFKADAERTASRLRDELGLQAHSPLNIRHAARFLGIPVLSLHDLGAFGASEQSIEHLISHGARELSALTVSKGSFRAIVENPVHPPGRRANSVAHELSHVLLDHEGQDLLAAGGVPRWDAQMEAEADWLAGTLLIPRPAALEIARSDRRSELAAREYGVSHQLLEWRLNQTGARKQAVRAARQRSA